MTVSDAASCTLVLAVARFVVDTLLPVADVQLMAVRVQPSGTSSRNDHGVSPGFTSPRKKVIEPGPPASR